MIDLMRILAGLIVWSGVFAGVYGLHGIGCEAGWSQIGPDILSLQRAVLVGAWLAGIAAQAVVVVALRRPPLGSTDPFIRRISVTLAAVGVVATLWSLFAVAVLGTCA